MTPIAVWLTVFFLVLVAQFVRNTATKQALLLAGSYLFYQFWGLPFLAILIVSSICNFYLGTWLRRRPTTGRLWAGILFNISLLSFFKYLPAVFGGSSDFFRHVVMPAGMSFWTFQAMSYLFDIYHEENVEPSLLEFCLYMAFWPTVLMGPVCRLPKMLPQFRQTKRLSVANLTSGLQRIGVGLLMKLVLAQLLASALAGFEENGRAWSGTDVWFLSIGFGFQLFFDFAGYSNIVIGAAKVFGFELPENFDSPYLSTTPSIFWTRWHMSLSSWIRDYVFVSLAALQRAAWWRYTALILSMTLFGLWHGAKLTFVLWGVYQGVFLALHRILQQLQRRFNFSPGGKLGELSAGVITFFGVTLGWILFRAKDLHEAAVMYGAVLSPASYRKFELPRNYYGLLITLAAGYFLVHAILNSSNFQRIRTNLEAHDPNPRFIQLCWHKRWWGLAPMFLILVIFAGLLSMFQTAGVTPFIYAGF